jgi:hypothetical protein
MLMGKSTKDIYNQQNRSLHKAFSLVGLPYNQNKKHWLGRVRSEVERDVSGLSELTLAERSDLIASFKKDFPDLYNPFVPFQFRSWKSSDSNKEDVAADRPIKVPKEKQPLVGKIKALLTDQKKTWAYADGISKRMFKIDIVEHCKIDQLYKVVQALSVYQKRKGKAT